LSKINVLRAIIMQMVLGQAEDARLAAPLPFLQAGLTRDHMVTYC
jgi:hypothetical protein